MSMKEIFTRIAQETGFTLDDMRGPSQCKMLSEARQDGMLQAYDAGHTKPEIAIYLHRDHSTIHSGIVKANGRKMSKGKPMDRSKVTKASRAQRQTIRHLQEENNRLRDMLIDAEDRNRKLEEKIRNSEIQD